MIPELLARQTIYADIYALTPPKLQRPHLPLLTVKPAPAARGEALLPKKEAVSCWFWQVLATKIEQTLLALKAEKAHSAVVWQATQQS